MYAGACTRTENEAPSKEIRTSMQRTADPLIGTAEVARRLGRHESTIDRWLASGLLPSPLVDPINRRRYWPASTVEALRERLTPQPTATTQPTPAR
jgi:predicted DNA-binding transcriptional regulator AlpA